MINKIKINNLLRHLNICRIIYYMEIKLTKQIMIQALTKLDDKLTQRCSLLIGGGGALLLSDYFPLATADLDAFPKGIMADELGLLVKQVALELNLPGDWLNPYFASFTHVLPHDFESRLNNVFSGEMLIANALGKEDLLIMKCFAHRQKDIPHARALVKKGADLNIVEKQMQYLSQLKTKGIREALEFLDQILELEDL